MKEFKLLLRFNLTLLLVLCFVGQIAVGADFVRPPENTTPYLPWFGSDILIKLNTDSDLRPGTDSDLRPGTDSNLRPGTDSDLRPGTDSDLRPGTDSDLRPGTDSDLRPGTDSDLRPGTDSDLRPGTDSDLRPGDEVEHEWYEATCTEPKRCKCGETEGEALGHSFTNYVSNNDAGFFKDGTETAVCDRENCGATDTRVDIGSAYCIIYYPPVVPPTYEEKDETVPEISEEEVAVLPFVDVKEDAYYYDAVEWAYTNNIINGTSDTAFSPFSACTRAQVIHFIWRAMGSPEPANGEMPFIDVSADAYYAKAVLWAIEQNITTGTSENTFNPDDTVTCAQFVTFLWRCAGCPVVENAVPFTDVPDGEYYTEAVIWAAANGITEGTGENTFSPNSSCTRAQVVTFLYRYFAA